MDQTATNASTTTYEKILQSCGCGWERKTLTGHCIHMGRKCVQTVSSNIAMLKHVRQMGSKAGLKTTVLLGPELQKKSRKRGGRRREES